MGGIAALINKGEGEKAAETQARAADRATDVQYKMFQESQAERVPWTEAGKTSVSTLMGGPIYGPSRTEQRLTGYERGGGGQPTAPISWEQADLYPGLREMVEPGGWTPVGKWLIYNSKTGQYADRTGTVLDPSQMEGPMLQMYPNLLNPQAQGQGKPIYETVTIPGERTGYEGGLLTQGPGEFTESPGYQFRLGEGVKALDRSAASRGRLRSGAQDKALIRYGQDYATNEYDMFLNRYYQSLNPWFSMAGMGQISVNAGGNQAVQTGQGVASSIMAGGAARASGYINTANATNMASYNAGNIMGRYGQNWWGGGGGGYYYPSVTGYQSGGYAGGGMMG